MLEPQILRIAAKRADKNTLASWKAFFEAQAAQADAEVTPLPFPNEDAAQHSHDADAAFHLFLAHSLGNRYILQQMEELMAQSQRIRSLSNARRKSRYLASIQEHIRIVDALLQGFLREELGDAQVYAYLSSCTPRREMARAFRALSEDEKRHARDLAAAIYLITGKAYCPRVCVEQPDTCDLCALLRSLYHAEACAGYNYARAGEETLDLCLSKLFAAMSEDEYRHAELLMKLLGRKMNV